MTPQARLVLLGTAVTLGTKIGFQKDWHTALTFGLAAIAFAAILTAQETQPDGN